MEGNAVKLMNELLSSFLDDIDRDEFAEVKLLTRQNNPESINVVSLIIYMREYKKTRLSSHEIMKEMADANFIRKLIEFYLRQGDEKYFNWIKEYRSSKIGTAENAGKICSGLRLLSNGSI